MIHPEHADASYKDGCFQTSVRHEDTTALSLSSKKNLRGCAKGSSSMFICFRSNESLEACSVQKFQILRRLAPRVSFCACFKRKNQLHFYQKPATFLSKTSYIFVVICASDFFRVTRLVCRSAFFAFSSAFYRVRKAPCFP